MEQGVLVSDGWRWFQIGAAAAAVSAPSQHGFFITGTTTVVWKEEKHEITRYGRDKTQQRQIEADPYPITTCCVSSSPYILLEFQWLYSCALGTNDASSNATNYI